MAEAPVATFRMLKERFFDPCTKVPAPGRWREMDDNLIWKGMVVQVMVVGGSRPVEKRFEHRPDLQHRVSYTSLTSLTDNLESTISDVLRETGVRYASSEASKCKKTQAIVRNLEIVKGKGGPRAFLEAIAALGDERQRILELQRSLKYFKSKSARDYLMEFGLLEEALALDSRVMTVLALAGEVVDPGVKSNEAIYAREEARLLADLCKPLGMKGIEFDRMLYQNYPEILHLLRNDEFRVIENALRQCDHALRCASGSGDAGTTANSPVGQTSLSTTHSLSPLIEEALAAITRLRDGPTK